MHANMAVVVGHTTTYGYAEKKVRSFLSLPCCVGLLYFFHSFSLFYSGSPVLERV